MCVFKSRLLGRSREEMERNVYFTFQRGRQTNSVQEIVTVISHARDFVSAWWIDMLLLWNGARHLWEHFIVLQSLLSQISIEMLQLSCNHCLWCDKLYFFPFHFWSISSKQYILTFFLKSSLKMCFLIRLLNPFTFNFIIATVGFMFVI